MLQFPVRVQAVAAPLWVAFNQSLTFLCSPALPACTPLPRDPRWGWSWRGAWGNWKSTPSYWAPRSRVWRSARTTWGARRRDVQTRQRPLDNCRLRCAYDEMSFVDGQVSTEVVEYSIYHQMSVKPHVWFPIILLELHLHVILEHPSVPALSWCWGLWLDVLGLQ